jgi:hypothetical protein
MDPNLSELEDSALPCPKQIPNPPPNGAPWHDL